MAFAIPEIDTEVDICMKNPLIQSARHWGMPDYFWYRGKILKSKKWMSPGQFCLSTDNPDAPFRILDQDRILDLQFVDGRQAEQVELIEKPKFQIWQVSGSKGEVYNVTINEDKWSCDCIAGQFNRPCKHVKKIQEEMCSNP